MKINFTNKFNELGSTYDILKRVEANASIKVFYGYTKDGKRRLAFLSKIQPEYINSTKMISVNHYQDNSSLYWLSFDLENNALSNLFNTFCSDMVNSLDGINNEEIELKCLKKRFDSWKKMFQNTPQKELSEEEEQGLFGELYFLYKFMAPKYGLEKAIFSWTGPLDYSKDFSIDETWYEIKTSNANASSIKISSINQLDSDKDGFLGVIKIEKMSNEYRGTLSSVFELIEAILNEIKNTQTQEVFIEKLSKFSFDTENNAIPRRYDVKSMTLYNVTDDFPRLTKTNIAFPEIENVSYTINLAGIERFKKEEK